MKIYFMLAFERNKKLPNPVLVEVFEILKRRGMQVEVGVANELVWDAEQLSVQHDLYVLKSHTNLWLYIAGILHRQGAKLLNPYLSCHTAQNKIYTSWLLKMAGILTPSTWLTGNLTMLSTYADQFPLVIKPYDGRRGIGVVYISSSDELQHIPLPQKPVLIQRYIQGDELKVYVIGERVFAIRKHTLEDGTTKRELCAVSTEIRTVALRCGRISGLGIYGMDIIESTNGPVVIDLNYFPSYKGIPHAADLIANYIEEYAFDYLPGLVLPHMKQKDPKAADIHSISEPLIPVGQEMHQVV